MLIQFSVENFLSFKEKQTLTTLANSDKTHSKNLVNFKDKDYSKINVIYGANASGKTNFIKAIIFLKNFLFNSNNLLEGTIIPITPFRFSDNYKDGKSTFELIFVKKNIRYEYSFTCDKEKVYEESLYIDENNRAATVFERTNVNDYVFKQDKSLLEDISQKNTNNKLFLVTAATWNYDRVKPVVEYILNDLVTILDYEINLPKMIDTFKSLGEYDEFKKFSLKLLEQGDFTISDFSMNNQKIDSTNPMYNQLLNTFLNQLPKDLKFDDINLNEVKFNTIHNINENNIIKPYNLGLEYESLGTVNLLKFTAILFDVLKRGKTLIVDEIDRSLHPLLVDYIINIFVDEKININNAQLIFNTHDINLLSLELFRRDEIWFTERNVNTGSSILYPLTDYSPRKDENIQKGYLVGRYGAIPFINGDTNIWEE